MHLTCRVNTQRIKLCLKQNHYGELGTKSMYRLIGQPTRGCCLIVNTCYLNSPSPFGFTQPISTTVQNSC